MRTNQRQQSITGIALLQIITSLYLVDYTSILAIRSAITRKNNTVTLATATFHYWQYKYSRNSASRQCTCGGSPQGQENSRALTFILLPPIHSLASMPPRVAPLLSMRAQFFSSSVPSPAQRIARAAILCVRMLHARAYALSAWRYERRGSAEGGDKGGCGGLVHGVTWRQPHGQR